MKTRRTYIVVLFALLLASPAARAQQPCAPYPAPIDCPVTKGMTPKELKELLGRPDRTDAKAGQWYYHKREMLVYFENGKVTNAFQQRGEEIVRVVKEPSEVATTLSKKDDLGWGIAAFLFLALAAVLYFLPMIVAAKRRHHNVDAIAVLDLLLGWTILGWIIALVWACTEVHVPAEHAQG